ncbi:plasmid mobilization protein [Fodinibius halophilus]|uniref:Plasmid mobilization relaxosome protein MobC n=1 Tax=Fodinibius halophilus TaxID=1736908 RepID=A0A6M1T6C2_9BACT|nr:plasmid mobilization relaxosome protein MobC [Fodinibius halophilus]NGP87571.1 plasmid mobilization relaxosome protein MobC [Fodinibius halophilus]
MQDNGDDDKVDQQMKIYVTKDEKLELVDMADTIGMSFSSFARAVLLDYEIEEQPVELHRIRHEINKIGVNINQLAKVANQEGKLPSMAELIEISDFLKEKAQEI